MQVPYCFGATHVPHASGINGLRMVPVVSLQTGQQCFGVYTTLGSCSMSVYPGRNIDTTSECMTMSCRLHVLL